MKEKLKLAIDSESVNIYIDNGDEQEPTHVCYWHIEEWEEGEEFVCMTDLSPLLQKEYIKELNN